MRVRIPAFRPAAAHAGIAFAAGEAAIAHRGGVHTVPSPVQVDQLDTDELSAVLSSLLEAAGLRRVRAVIALPSQTAPLTFRRDVADPRKWAAEAASELVPEGEPVVLSGGARRGARWACAATREAVLKVLEACRAAGIVPAAVEPAALALLRLARAAGGSTVVAAVSPAGCEIAAAEGTVPVLARSALARSVEDVASEVELTVRYLERGGGRVALLALAGPAAEQVAAILQGRGIEAQRTLPAQSAAGVVADGAARRPRGAPDFLRIIEGRGFGIPQAAAAAGAILLVVSAAHALSERSRADALRAQVTALGEEQATLRARLSRWKGPRAQAAAAALRILDSQRTSLDPLDRLRDLVPADLWLERIDISGTSLRLDGRSVSTGSVLRFSGAARGVWESAVLQAVERTEEPAPSYRFTLDAGQRPDRGASQPVGPGR